MKLKNLLFFLNGIILFECCPVSPKKLFAKAENKNLIKEININYDLSKSENIDTLFKSLNNTYIKKYEVVEDLKVNGDDLFNLLAFEKSDFKKKYFVDISSDIQYKEKEVFHAEGNAIMYFSNASLKGDLIKYDLQKKLLTVVGNVIFKKGEQYFEASKLYFDLKKDTGYIEDIYGVIDNKTFSDDFKIEIDKSNRKVIDQNNQLSKSANSSDDVIGLGIQYEDDASNINSVDSGNSIISKLRYKADKITYESKTLRSKKIFFTNDLYNEPQFVFVGKNFSAEIIDQKLRLLSRNSWIILDNKLKIPIGRRSIFEGESFKGYGFGADYKDKDGYYLSRGFYPKGLFNDYSFQLTPHFLIQRALKGSTNSFTAKNSSVFTQKVNSDINFSDYFGLDLNIKGKENDWDVEANIQLNSLNTDRLGESLRTKITFTKRINLNEITDYKRGSLNDKDLDYLKNKEKTKDIGHIIGQQLNLGSTKKHSEKSQKEFTNFLDLKFYNLFREEIIKDFVREDIYFASGFNISNKKSWTINDRNSNLNFIYDVGHFKSKSIAGNEFRDLLRNSFVAEYSYKFPLWKKKSLDKIIDKSYKYSPEVISQSLKWFSGLQSGLFLYSDGSIQSALKLNTGPVLTYGSFKKKFIDYTKVGIFYSHIFKGGESPYSFDDIDKDPRIDLNLQQQIYGPLVFTFDTILNLNNGTYSNFNYGLDFRRRAYSLGAFYNTTDESLGIRFNIFNFDYLGLNKKF